MRIIPVLTALIVSALFYVFILERDVVRAIAGAQTPPEAGTTETETDAAAVAVVAWRSQAREMENGIVLRGRTEANRRVVVRAETTGQVISEPLRKGSVVAKGDLLCEIDAGTREAQLEEARARYAEAEANSRASESLARSGYTAETTAIGNRAALIGAQAAIEQAELELGRLKIHAPFGGLLESDTAEIGSLLQPGSECATIIDLDPITLAGYVPENVVDSIEVGAQVGARLVNGREFTGTVSFVSRSSDPQTRTFLVEATAPNADRTIRDGITAEIQIALAGKLAHVIPQSALTLNDDGAMGVRTVDGERAGFVPVRAIRDTAEGMLVSGLPETVDIIVTGQDFVTEGHPITVTYRETATGAAQ